MWEDTIKVLWDMKIDFKVDFCKLCWFYHRNWKNTCRPAIEEVWDFFHKKIWPKWFCLELDCFRMILIWIRIEFDLRRITANCVASRTHPRVSWLFTCFQSTHNKRSAFPSRLFELPQIIVFFAFRSYTKTFYGKCKMKIYDNGTFFIVVEKITRTHHIVGMPLTVNINS